MRRNLTENLETKAGHRFTGLRSLPVASKIALIFLALIAAMAIFAPLISSYDPLASSTPVQPPSGEHWFGTDAIGRDIFARVAFGARSSLVIGLCATAAALAAAAVLGSIAATGGKVVSEVLMRILDIIMSFPGIALAAVFVAVFGTSLPVLVFAIGFLYVPQLSRVVRANILSEFGEDYVAAAKVMGARIPHILLKHVARNTIAPIAVFATVLVADAIVFEASLSFINAGVKPPEPSWGNILADGKQLLLSGAWWPTFFPGLMILLTVLALNILSEGLTDAMASPRIKRTAAVSDNDPTIDKRNTLGHTTEEEAAKALNTSLAKLHDAEMSEDRRLNYTRGEEPLIVVKDLSIAFPNAHGDVKIVDKVNFTVSPGETMGLVGESGCGKSLIAMTIMGLLPPTAVITGEILYGGKNLLEMSADERNALRGHDMAMIYQDALSSLNPSMLISTQLNQLIRRGGKRTAEELMELVGLDPVRTLKSYPHELSGGQRQRVLIAMALTRNPRLLIADEPTTALDVTVQHQVVDLLNELREKLGFSMIFVSHDLALVAKLAHKITVMYAGQVVEQGHTRELLADPHHEYTRGLLGAVLSIESGASRLYQVPGTVPSPREFVAGDRFAPRSSHPQLGLNQKPVMRAIDGTSTHRWAATDELLAAMQSKGE
ncbi:putative oligopeptide ABC transport system membrane protein [Corynebacterium diphtheriae HC01]|uniref:Oligopeptide transport system (Integral membrane and ATP-binding proteins) n=3 Tax=Corynebacterium diphtheriae TaxID=1717 RepID=Q6NJ99_CORDI|nr:dipeptide/oligopeptide/nickel ABC transporter permease/ATP-binding protein [Corynebacterium diphtheriae]AEX43518.1 putative oligopeptide ABC transport system membrane protein [Corynebacterium diphtheriae 241]AEX45736.1 putative oligopeptide ABC transport system membrane protein [Corynebacterium diphtheriae INCA 402]AEX47992.1 putative oligopeptide ABC transport system membrane protein [Corynebacterium diphtheriae BH8]AEX73705.1 putative oligopeptide ABC transport system membrane protein [Cor